MATKKLNTVQRLFLKHTDKEAYQHYKYLLRVDEAPELKLLAEAKSVVNFKHSGHLGDVIYAIPAMYALAGGGKVNLLLNINAKLPVHSTHPLKGIGLNERSVAMLKPLLAFQEKFHQVSDWKQEPLDYDLDLFREFPLDLTRGSISRWYFSCFATHYDLSQPWLLAPQRADMADKVVIARSARYNSPVIDYSFLNQYTNLVFVGMPDEYLAMRKVLPRIEHIQVSDYLELASVINGAKFFIGNQSFPFSVAEALKVPRLLESYYKCPNVIPEGANGFEFCFQPQFETLVHRLMGS